MSEFNYDKIQDRKNHFMKLYNDGKDITEIANELKIEVHSSEKLNDDVLGVIQYTNEKSKFQMIINVKNKIDIATSKARVLLTVAHEVAHWIYDYDEMKYRDEVFYETESLDITDKREVIASIVASNIMLGIDNPLIDETKFYNDGKEKNQD